MMENESLRSPKNTSVVFLSVVLVGAVIWGIVASVMASQNRKQCEKLTQANEQLRTENEQIRMEAERRIAEAEKLRKVALEWTRQHQLRLQEEMQKKAAEAAKAAAEKAKADKAKADKAKTDKKPAVKAPVKSAVKKTTTTKPAVHR